MTEETEKQLLDELRKQTTATTKQTRDNRIGMIGAGILMLVFIASLSFHERVLSRLKPVPQAIDTWREARNLGDKGDFQKSEEMTKRLIKEHPDYYYGYYLLGSLYQEIGNLNEAEANYVKAYSLFPTEKNEKDLVAIRKVIEMKNATTNQASKAFTEWMAWVPFQEFLAEKEKKDEDSKNFWDKGHWILAAEGQWKDGQQQYRIKIGDSPKNKAYLWMWYINQEQKDFDKLIEKFTTEGYTMVYCNSFTRPSGTTLYQAVWHNENPAKK